MLLKNIKHQDIINFKSITYNNIFKIDFAEKVIHTFELSTFSKKYPHFKFQL